MTRHELILYGRELDAPEWSMEVARSLLDLLIENPWRPLNEMHGGASEPFEPFERAKALEVFRRKRCWYAQSGPDMAVAASLVSARKRNVVTLSVMSDVFGETPLPVVPQILARMHALMPHLDSLEANADRDQTFFKHERKLGWLPKILPGVHWLQAVCPPAYAKFFDREALLDAPAHRIEEHADGSIWIWAYENPFEFASPATRDAIATLHRYLQEHLKVIA